MGIWAVGIIQLTMQIGALFGKQVLFLGSLTSSLCLAGSDFPCGWHHLHEWEHGAHYNWLDLQPPKFQASLTQRKLPSFSTGSGCKLCSKRHVSYFALRIGMLVIGNNKKTLKTFTSSITRHLQKRKSSFLSRMVVYVFKICGAHFYPGFARGE